MFKSDHTAFAVRDLVASRAFYEFLGGRVVSKPSPAFLEVMLGDLRLHFVRASEERARRAGELGIDHVCVSVATTSDLEALCIRLNNCPMLEGKGPFAIEDSEMLGGDGAVKEHAEQRPPRKTLYIEDPDGIAIEIRAYA